jgi:DNA-binding transcriptional LysR family regulator
MELRQIYCFLAVADELHFGKAAEKLRVAQSWVSEAIQSLNERSHAFLFQYADSFTRDLRAFLTQPASV